MRIGICGSMHFSERMIEVAEALKGQGHDPFLPSTVEAFVGKNEVEKQRLVIHEKMHDDAILNLWDRLQDADAILVLNFDRHGIQNYIGGNTFLEMGFAYALKHTIFLWNPIPDIPYYKSEIEAMRPVVIEGDLGRIKK